jgi:hypothetical protein
LQRASFHPWTSHCGVRIIAFRCSNRRFEGEIAVASGVEGRIEINEVNDLVLEVTPEDFEVVAVIKQAHLKVDVESQGGRVKQRRKPNGRRANRQNAKADGQN